MKKVKKPVGLSDNYWNSLSAEHQEWYEVVRPMTKATYEVDVSLTQVERFLEQQSADMASMGGVFELDPDYQRGHVWSMAQRVAYIESLLREIAPRTIMFNAPGYSREREPGDIPAHTFQCIDGLQRLTSVRKFMAGEIKVFGDKSCDDLTGSPFDPRRYRLSIAVYEFSNRADLLQFYLDLNTAGTAHSVEEIERVRGLLTEAQGPGQGNG